MRTVQLTDNFWPHQLALSMGKKRESNSSYINTSQTKSYMILTCSMATNNNNLDEPRITALERQVQTIVAAVEYLT